MRTELEPARYLDHVYRVADSIDEGLSSVNEGLSSFTRSAFDALKATALHDLTRKRSVHCGFIKLLF